MRGERAAWFWKQQLLATCLKTTETDRQPPSESRFVKPSVSQSCWRGEE
ncbi:hypothetical protein HMPREF9057_00902 [Actinomyces sp. oral taxon 171 str. F0337]|nr:hypothetical protein HMPREF9057_00902 [Actinomyces sp. oral taxon 171 str. F0337]